MRAFKGRGLKWQAGVTSKLAQDDRMLELAAESGCTLLSIGFESISRKMAEAHLYPRFFFRVAGLPFPPCSR
jgi:hypothetical protein